MHLGSTPCTDKSVNAVLVLRSPWWLQTHLRDTKVPAMCASHSQIKRTDQYQAVYPRNRPLAAHNTRHNAYGCACIVCASTWQTIAEPKANKQASRKARKQASKQHNGSIDHSRPCLAHELMAATELPAFCCLYAEPSWWSQQACSSVSVTSSLQADQTWAIYDTGDASNKEDLHHGGLVN